MFTLLPARSARANALGRVSRLALYSNTNSPRRQFSASPLAMRISDGIKKDHRELEEYYNNIINATDNDTKVRWQNQFTWELARHSIGEELLIYPIMEHHLREDGTRRAERDRAEHRVVKEQLKKFQNMEPTDPEFIPTIESLMTDLKRHMEEEENEDLPALEKALPAEHSDHLEKSFERTKMFTPTRSHPSAPDKPPFETVMGLLAAPLDKLGDMFRKFPQ